MELRSLTVNDTSERQYVALAEKGGERSLTIVIGYTEIQAIQRFVKGITLPRPMTHDLASSLIEEAGATLERVEVTDLREGTFFAKIWLRLADGNERAVDSRPSDAIALATARKKPLFVAEHVLRDAAMP